MAAGEYVTLVGAERVKNAGHAMQDAAARMERVASVIAESLQQHERRLDDLLRAHEERLDAILKSHEP